jgi:hypothetical protein
MKLFHKTIKPSFPDPRDICPPLTPQEALAALGLLRLLVDAGVADVYTRPFMPSGQRPAWNVWLDVSVVPGGLRIDLREWCARAVCVDYTPGGDAA